MSILSLPTFSMNSNGKDLGSLTQFVWDANVYHTVGQRSSLEYVSKRTVEL